MGGTLTGAACIVIILISSLLGAAAAGRWDGSIYSRVSGMDKARARIEGLQREVQALRAGLAEARGQADELRLRLQEANQTILALNQTITVLRAKLESANASIERLQWEAGRLRGELEEKNRTIASLQDRVESLAQQLELAWQSLNETRESLDSLRNAVREAAEWEGLEGPPISPRILAMAPGTVEDRAASLLAGLDTTEERVEAVIDWIALNLYYQNDSVVRLVDPDSGRVVAWGQSVMLPNETLENGGGDCDDLAVLVYALLKAYPLPGERVWVIGLQGYSAGHAAVLVRSPEGLYYIVDPTGSMINSVSAYMEVHVVNQSDGETYLFWFNPMTIHPHTKKYMINNSLASIVYDSALLGPFLPNTSWPAGLGSKDLDDTIWNWQFVTGIIFPFEYFIADSSGYHEFETRSDLVSWIEGQA